MKILMINGSPRSSGNTFVALSEMKKIFEEEIKVGFDYESTEELKAA